MSDPVTSSSNASSTSCRPYFFHAFQKIYCNTDTNALDPSASLDHLPIRNFFRKEARRIVDEINKIQKSQMPELTKSTSRIPHQVFSSEIPTQYRSYLLDRSMMKTFVEAQVINWVPRFKKLYPIRTSGLVE